MLRPLLIGTLLVTAAACGSSSTSSTSASSSSPTTAASSPAGTATVPAAAAGVPEVKLPSSTPTKLVVTDITEGSGPGAKDGDTLYVRYVGVRSENGERFDENFTGADPFELTLGAGGVIVGWDQGLVGARQGGRRQLDIPAELAYGDQPRGEVIKAGDALSFVVDIVGLAAAADPADKPQVTISGAVNVDAVATTDLVVGDGPAAEDGDHVVVQISTYRADTGVELDSTYTSGHPLVFELGANAIIPGLEQAVSGMRVGGRRQAQLPFAQAFGEAGRPDAGLPAATDVIVVVDLTNVF